MKLGKTRASSCTEAGLIAAVQQYFYSPSIRFEGCTVHNSRGRMDYIVRHRAGRFQLVEVVQWQ